MSNACRLVSVALLASLAGCGSDQLVSVSLEPNRMLSADVGNEILITLQTIGPASVFVAPPSVSSASIAFVDVTQADVAVPAGPTQRFRFRAVSKGRAVIVFTRGDSSATVQDTVVVR